MERQKEEILQVMGSARETQVTYGTGEVSDSRYEAVITSSCIVQLLQCFSPCGGRSRPTGCRLCPPSNKDQGPESYGCSYVMQILERAVPRLQSRGAGRSCTQLTLKEAYGRLTGKQPAASYGTRRLITVFTTARHKLLL